MAILQGIENRDRDNFRFTPSSWNSPISAYGLGGIDDIINIEIPRYEKIAFNFSMSLVKDPLEPRHAFNLSENDWFRHKINNHLELEDPSGKLYSLDEIYLEKHHLPTNLRHDERIVCHPDFLMEYLQNRNFNLYINSGHPSPSHRMKLLNPIITRLDKTEKSFPGLELRPRLGDLPDRRCVLDFEILCDSYQEVPIYNAATIQQVVRETLKKNITSPPLSTRQDILTIQGTISEMKARESLRDMLSEKEWRKYLTNGFVMVQGNSGKCYQVFNKQKHLRVYDKGKFIKELCIHTDAKECPPTDHVINMKIMLECDEQAVWDNSNLYSPTKKTNVSIIEDNSNIIDLFSKLKTDNQFVKNRIDKRRQFDEDNFFREWA